MFIKPLTQASNDDLRDLCIAIQVKTKLTDAGWKKQFGNEEGLYGLIHQHTAKVTAEAVREAKVNILSEQMRKYRDIEAKFDAPNMVLIVANSIAELNHTSKETDDE